MRRVGPPLAERFQRLAETDLGRGPLHRHPLAAAFQKRQPIHLDGLIELRVSLVAAPSAASASPRLLWVAAQSSGTRSRVRSSRAWLKAAMAASSRVVPASQSPRPVSARPRLFSVVAQSKGARSRVLSSRAASKAAAAASSCALSCIRSPSCRSALPRLFCVAAQSCGYRSRGRNSRAWRKACAGLLDRHGIVGAVTDDAQHLAEIGLGGSPGLRSAVAGAHLEHLSIGLGRLFQARRPDLVLAQHLERLGQAVLGRRPRQRLRLAAAHLQGLAERLGRFLQPSVIACPLAELQSALPRSVWIPAQASGACSRGRRRCSSR